MGMAVAGTYGKAGNAASEMEEALKLFVAGIPGVSGGVKSTFRKTGTYGITFTYTNAPDGDSVHKTTDCFLEFKQSGPDDGVGSLVAFAGGYDKVLPDAVKEHISKRYPDQHSEQKMPGSRDGFHCWDCVRREDLMQPSGALSQVKGGRRFP
jgi:hypothetical protein